MGSDAPNTDYSRCVSGSGNSYGSGGAALIR